MQNKVVTPKSALDTVTLLSIQRKKVDVGKENLKGRGERSSFCRAILLLSVLNGNFQGRFKSFHYFFILLIIFI